MSVKACFRQLPRRHKPVPYWRILALVAASHLQLASVLDRSNNFSRVQGMALGAAAKRGAIPMSTPTPDSFRKESSQKESAPLRCRICDKPVAIETAKSDAAGRAVHEECYALKVKLEQASQDGHADATRPWKVVAAEVSREHDPQKMIRTHPRT